MPVEQAHDPFWYSAIWAVTGAALLVTAVLWISWILLAPRSRSAGHGGGELEFTLDLSGLKRSCLRAIDAAEQGAAAGTITTRQAHLDISLALRTFAGAASGFVGPAATASDLDNMGHDSVAHTIWQLYPTEFGALGDGSVEQAAERAREAVVRWS